MSDNYNIVTQPKRWASAHKPVEFVYDMPFAFGSFTDNNGFVKVDMISALAGGKNIVAGDLIYINGGIYLGYHVVKSVVSNIDFTLETAYTASQAGVMVKYATPPQWQIWKGYQDSEVSGTNYFPFTKVADFAPEGNIDGYLSFNIGGYIKSSMKPIEPPAEGTLFGSVAIYADTSLWMPYRIFIGLNERSLYFENIYLALNSSIESDTLNAEYLNTDKALNTNTFINSCGTTFLSFLGTNGLTTLRLEGELPVSTGDFNDDFNNDFFNE